MGSGLGTGETGVGGGVWQSKLTGLNVDKRTDVWESVFMLAAQDVWPSSTANLTNDERRERLRAKAHVIDMLILSFSQEAAEFAATDAWEEDGSASAIDWIRFNCHLTSVAAADRIAVGESLQRMPQSAEAAANGEIGFAHLKGMARTADAVGDRFDEAVLLEKARENSPGKFYYICNHYRHAADRRGYEAEQAALVENRKLSISTCDDGAVLINGVLDPVGGAAFITAIEPLARKSGADDDRSREKRLGDALVDLSLHALDSGLIPQQGSQRTHLQVTTTLETLLGLAGAPAAELEFAKLPISSKTVERRLRLLGHAHPARLGLHGHRRRAGQADYLRTGAQGAQRARSGLHWPGCERPASWTSGHHIQLQRGRFLVAQDGAQPALRLRHRHPLPARVILDLIAADFPDHEVPRLRMREVKARHGCGRRHRA
jgi:Domain of unknown function (DUF222)